VVKRKNFEPGALVAVMKRPVGTSAGPSGGPPTVRNAAAGNDEPTTSVADIANDAASVRGETGMDDLLILAILASVSELTVTLEH
jgi:hypothetical protein